MNKKLTALAERRSRLVTQAAAQRAALTQHMEPWRARLALADRGITVIRYIRRHPALMVGAALLFAAVRPQRARKWLQRGWGMWLIGRRLR